MQRAMPRGATHAPAAMAAIAATLLMGACSQGEPQSIKARPNAPLAATQSSVAGGANASSVDDALKERLARQEAASKLFEKSAPPAPAPAKSPAPAVVASAMPATVPAQAVESQALPAAAPRAALPEVARPAPAASPPPPAASVPEPANEPAKEPPKAPRVELAAAKPASSPLPPSLAARLVSRIDPDFPREAVQAGIDRGTVRARMTLDNNGNVTRVEVVEANPRRVFDRAVTRALSQWRFSDGPSGRTVETEVDFKR